MAFYTIALNTIEIKDLEFAKIEELFPSIEPFKSNQEKGSTDPILHFECVPYQSLDNTCIKKQILHESNGLGEWDIYETEDGYCIDLEFEKGFPIHRMVSNKNFSKCKAAILFGEPHGCDVFSTFVMISYAQRCTQFSTAMFHTSVVLKDNKGYAFLGKSGTGKSTHTRLWLNNIPNTELLNDDNPAVRVMKDGTIHIFGTPWSGKTECYKNKDVELGGFVLLKQAAENRIYRLNPLQSYIALLNSTTCMKCNTEHFNQLGTIIEKINNKVPLFYFENLPIPESALLSYSTLQIENLSE